MEPVAGKTQSWWGENSVWASTNEREEAADDDGGCHLTCDICLLHHSPWTHAMNAAHLCKVSSSYKNQVNRAALFKQSQISGLAPAPRGLVRPPRWAAALLATWHGEEALQEFIHVNLPSDGEIRNWAQCKKELKSLPRDTHKKQA